MSLKKDHEGGTKEGVDETRNKHKIKAGVCRGGEQKEKIVTRESVCSVGVEENCKR